MACSKTTELLSYPEFIERIRESVKETMGNGYRVDVNHVLKNNSIELDGLIILKENERISPNIYLNSYYDRYLEGEELDRLTGEMTGIYMDTTEEGEKEAVCLRYEFGEMKPCIVYRLVNYERNRRMLLEVPHIRFLDLAVTFHCLVKNNEEGIGTIRITNEHMQSWGTDIRELKEAAQRNTPLLFPPIVRSMDEIVQEMLGKDSADVQQVRQNYAQMYVLSNKKGINGAGCLLYSNLIKDLADRLESDFYILPSSIHEIILVMDNGQLNRDILKEMVFDVNRTQVPMEDVLSDTVYCYSREKDAISM